MSEQIMIERARRALLDSLRAEHLPSGAVRVDGPLTIAELDDAIRAMIRAMREPLDGRS